MIKVIIVKYTISNDKKRYRRRKLLLSLSDIIVIIREKIVDFLILRYLENTAMDYVPISEPGTDLGMRLYSCLF